MQKIAADVELLAPTVIPVQLEYVRHVLSNVQWDRIAAPIALTGYQVVQILTLVAEIAEMAQMAPVIVLIAEVVAITVQLHLVMVFHVPHAAQIALELPVKI